MASALRAAAERRDDELVNLTGPRVYHWQVRVAAETVKTKVFLPVIFLSLIR